MKRALLLLAMLAVSSCTPVYAENWIEIAGNEDRTSFIDVDTVKFQEGTFVSFWIKSVYSKSGRKTAPVKGTTYIKTRYQASCDNYPGLSIRELYAYNAKDRIIQELKGNASASLIPGSLNETYHYAACEALKEENRRKREELANLGNSKQKPAEQQFVPNN